ncbi:MAG: apolipoprotein N-acyltransferase [Phycisphaerales bacterium]
MSAQTRSQTLVKPRTGLHWALLGLAAGAAYAVLGLLAAEPLAWWPFAPLSILPLMAAAVVGSRASRRAAWRLAAGAWIGSIPLWVLTHAWIFNVSPVGFFPGMLLQGSWAGVFVLLGSAALRGRSTPVSIALSAALAWSFVEIFRGSVLFGGYAWLLAGHAMIDAPFIARSGAVVGAYGVGFLLALSMGLLVAAATAREGRGRTALAACVPLLALAALALVAPKPGEPTGARVAIVQTNVPQDNRLAWTIEDQARSFDRFVELSRLAQGRADFVVWPETMLPGPPISPQAIDEMQRFGLVYATDLPGLERLPGWAFAEGATTLQAELGVPMIVGATGVDGLRLSTDVEGRVVQEFEGFFNSAHLLDDGRLSPVRYDKLRLTIFGEVLPLVSRWDWLERQLLVIGAGGMTFDLDAGRKPVWFDLDLGAGRSLRVATPICFEVAYSGVSRRLAGGGGDRVDALVNLTNDGWFGSSDAGRAMHLKLARWRALEAGVPMVRAANTGISTIIDATGAIAPTTAQWPEGQGPHAVHTAGQAFPTRTPGVVYGEIPPSTTRRTPFATFGFLTPWLLFPAGLFVVIRGLAGGPRPSGA